MFSHKKEEREINEVGSRPASEKQEIYVKSKNKDPKIFFHRFPEDQAGTVIICIKLSKYGYASQLHTAFVCLDINCAFCHDMVYYLNWYNVCASKCSLRHAPGISFSVTIN